MDGDNNFRKINTVAIDRERSKHDFEKLSKKSLVLRLKYIGNLGPGFWRVFMSKL